MAEFNTFDANFEHINNISIDSKYSPTFLIDYEDGMVYKSYNGVLL